jgi:hypothetical protein
MERDADASWAAFPDSDACCDTEVEVTGGLLERQCIRVGQYLNEVGDS